MNYIELSTRSIKALFNLGYTSVNAASKAEKGKLREDVAYYTFLQLLEHDLSTVHPSHYACFSRLLQELDNGLSQLPSR